jgi:hypothetical protein
MDQILEIPKDRKSLSVWRLCLLMGLTIMLYMMIWDRMGAVAVAM